MRLIYLFTHVTAVVVALIGCGSVARAQDAAGASKVTIVLASVPQAGSHVAILRRARQAPRQIVIVDQDATGADLALALGTLGAMRARDNDAPTTDAMVYPRGHLKGGGVTDRQVTALQGLLIQLHNAPVTNVQGIGAVQSWETDIGGTPHLKTPR